MKLMRFGVSLPEDLIRKFDRLIKRKRYPNRSEAIRDLVRRQLSEERLGNPEASAVAAVLLSTSPVFSLFLEAREQGRPVPARGLVGTALAVAGTLLAGTAVALFLNRPFPGRGIVAVCVLLPVATPRVAGTVPLTWRRTDSVEPSYAGELLMDSEAFPGLDRPADPGC
mgnify:CR=1 FL=1